MFQLNMNQLIGKVNVLFFTFDSLRYDTAQIALEQGKTPFFKQVLPDGKWEKRDAPGTFTLASHTAFFHGFFPTRPGVMQTFRPLSLAFEGSTTINANTYVFSTQNIIAGFQSLGYRTFCLGGVGFFNKRNPMGHFLPSYFQESYWDITVSVSAKDSAKNQCLRAREWIQTLPFQQKFLLFMNFSATHTPHGHYLQQEKDSVDSQIFALMDIDRYLPDLAKLALQRGDCLCFWMSDHGDTYGEDGLFGHRFAHPVVSTIPYAEFLLHAWKGGSLPCQ